MNCTVRNEGLQRVRTFTQGAVALAILGTGAVVFVSAQTAAAAEVRSAVIATTRAQTSGGQGLTGPNAAPTGVAPTAGLTADQQGQLLAQQQLQLLAQQQLQQQQQAPQSGGS
jgi:hypothetical protein